MNNIKLEMDTSLPSPFSLGRAGVGLIPFWGGFGCGLSATVVGLSPRMTRMITKNLFVKISEISGLRWMTHPFGGLTGINVRRNFAAKYFSKNEFK